MKPRGSPLRLVFTVLALWLAFHPSLSESNQGRRAAARRALDAILNEEIPVAHSLFDSLRKAEPDRPEGYLGRAMAYWEETLILEDTRRHDDEIEELLEKAIEVSERSVDKDGETSEMLFWLGSAYGLRSSVQMMRGNVFGGIVDGISGRDYLQEALDKDSSNIDARFGIGLSDYIIAKKPRLMRTVSRLFSLPSGDAEGGIRQLEMVAADGVFCQKHAISSRAFIELYYEKNYPEARRRFGNLMLRYPNSLDYRLRYLDSIFALTVKGSVEFYQALVDSARSARSESAQRELVLHPWIRTKLDFIEGYGEYHLGNQEASRRLMKKYLRDWNKKSWLNGLSELMLGKLADLRGDRKAAIDYYRRARKRENVWGVKAEAEKYLKQPFDGTEPTRRPVDKVRRYPQRP